MVLLARFSWANFFRRLVFSTKSIMPKLDRLNPLSGLKRMFSVNSVVELVKSIAKVLVVGLASWLVLKYYFNDALLLQRKALQPAIAEAVHIILWSIIFYARPRFYSAG